MSPTTGNEPKLNLDAWNNISNLKNSHNCFSYAMNTIDRALMKRCNETESCDVGFSQPGYASGHGEFSDSHQKGCSDMVSRLWGDNPDIRPISFSKKCPYTTSKIALIVDPDRDYHFLRQDSNGYWSHKPGSMKVTTLDSSDRPIVRPDLSLFIYKKHKEPLEYTKFCGYYCVPRDKPLYVSSEPRQEGGRRLFHGSTRYRLTRKKLKGDSRQSED